MKGAGSQISRGPGPKRPWKLAFTLDPASPTPLFLQLVRAVMRDIRRGRLEPGDVLPGSRALAAALGVTRKTVVSAIDELVAQGWLVTEPARGTFVAEVMPQQPIADAEPRRRRAEDEKTRELEAAWAPLPRGTLVFDDGTPDPRLAPLDALARAYRRALLGLSKTTSGYGDPRGDTALRDLVASLLNQARGLAISAEQVLISRGSQMALFLVARALLRDGDAVAVEDPGYRPAWEALRMAGARLIPIPVDTEGLRVDLLEQAARRHRVRAVYTTPHHQYPTTVSLSAPRRLYLLELAARANLTVIEDDYDHEYHFAGRPLLPLASSDELRSVVYVGSMSKLLAPSVRVGYLVAGRDFIAQAASIRAVLDRQGDPALERAVAELMEDGELQRHARKARRAYEERRDVLCRAIEAELGDALSFRSPPGGLALWCEVRADVDLEALRRRADAAKVAFTPGQAHAFDGEPLSGLRLGYASLSPAEIRAGVRRLGAALRAR